MVCEGGEQFSAGRMGLMVLRVDEHPELSVARISVLSAEFTILECRGQRLEEDALSPAEQRFDEMSA
jgi:hypothetical protein